MSTSKPQTNLEFPRPVRGLGIGDHPFLTMLPRALESPAFSLISSERVSSLHLVQSTKVQVVPEEGFCWVNDSIPCIVLAQPYYENGDDLDLYLDLLHELTHIRQVLEGVDVWDDHYPYHQRPTEIEGYAVAISEAKRLGLGRKALLEHLSNPWMTAEQVSELFTQVTDFLTPKQG